MHNQNLNLSDKPSQQADAAAANRQQASGVAAIARKFDVSPDVVEAILREANNGLLPPPVGWRAALEALQADQQSHNGQVAAPAAAGSRLHAGERHCTEGVILGIGYCIEALNAMHPTSDSLSIEETVESESSAVEERTRSVAAVKRAVETAVSGYLRRSSNGGMPKEDVDTVRAVVADMLRLSYLEDALELEGTKAAAILHENAFYDAIAALKTCTTDQHGAAAFDEDLVARTLFDLILIRTGWRRATATASRTN